MSFTADNPHLLRQGFSEARISHAVPSKNLTRFAHARMQEATNKTWQRPPPGSSAATTAASASSYLPVDRPSGLNRSAALHAEKRTHVPVRLLQPL